MSMLNSLCNDNTKRLIPQLITHPIKLAVMHDVILDTAKFQLGISFFSFKKREKDRKPYGQKSCSMSNSYFSERLLIRIGV